MVHDQMCWIYGILLIMPLSQKFATVEYFKLIQSMLARLYVKSMNQMLPILFSSWMSLFPSSNTEFQFLDWSEREASQ